MVVLVNSKPRSIKRAIMRTTHFIENYYNELLTCSIYKIRLKKKSLVKKKNLIRIRMKSDYKKKLTDE